MSLNEAQHQAKDGDLCIADSGATHTILKSKKYFFELKPTKGTIDTISDPTNLIDGVGKANVVLPNVPLTTVGELNLLIKSIEAGKHDELLSGMTNDERMAIMDALDTICNSIQADNTNADVIPCKNSHVDDLTNLNIDESTMPNDPIVQSVDINTKSTSYAGAAGASAKDQPKVNSNFRHLVADPVFDGVNISIPRKVVEKFLRIWVLVLLATFSARPIMLDSYYKFHVVNDSGGRSSFAQFLIEVNSEVDLVDVVTIGIPSLTRDDFIKETIRVEYEWRPPRCDICKIFGHVHDHCPKKVVSPSIVATSNVVTPTVEKINDGFQTVGKMKKRKEEDEEEDIENVYDEMANLFPNTKTGESSSFTAAADQLVQRTINPHKEKDEKNLDHDENVLNETQDIKTSPEEEMNDINKEMSINYGQTQILWDRNEIGDINEIFSYSIASDIIYGDDDPEPKSVIDCQRRPNWVKWKDAIQAELNSLNKRKSLSGNTTIWFVIIAVYVDDLIIIGTSKEINEVVVHLKEEFEMKDLDACYLSDPRKVRSQTGYVFLNKGITISWHSQKQTLVATSSNHAEVIALHEASRECVWLRSLTQLIVTSYGLNKEKSPTIIYEDNAACVAQMKESYIKSDRTKHIPPRYFAYTQDLIKDNQIEKKYVQSSNNSADLFTKSLPTSIFKKHVHAIGMWHVHKT
ncbi:hypothetical protein Tco_0824237 [Tanacetum coccineum]|uniref:Zinc knuckle CX2CX4HX4C n=1 Tax=Tanacetum coccineum TaxID=301880 RepID=A0ABQ5AL53_9ASTR